MGLPETSNFRSGPATFYIFLYKSMFRLFKILIRTGNFFSLVLNCFKPSICLRLNELVRQADLQRGWVSAGLTYCDHGKWEACGLQSSGAVRTPEQDYKGYGCSRTGETSSGDDRDLCVWRTAGHAKYWWGKMEGQFYWRNYETILYHFSKLQWAIEIPSHEIEGPWPWFNVKNVILPV